MNRKDQIKVQVKGFLVPIFSQPMEDGSGRTMHGLAPDGFQMVKDGFACGECLAMFSHYTITCPACHLSRDVAADVQETPKIWEEHLRERNAPWTARDKPKPRNPMAAMAGVSSDKDVEQISLKKLKNTRKR